MCSISYHVSCKNTARIFNMKVIINQNALGDGTIHVPGLGSEQRDEQTGRFGSGSGTEWGGRAPQDSPTEPSVVGSSMTENPQRYPGNWSLASRE